MAINWYQAYQTGSKYGVILEPNSDTSGTYFTQDNYIVLRQVGSSYVTLLLLLHHFLILLFSLLSSYNDTDDTDTSGTHFTQDNHIVLGSAKVRSLSKVIPRNFS